MTTEELHKYLTQHGIYLMGRLRRENLIEQVKKLRVYSDLSPADQILKIVPEVKKRKKEKEEILSNLRVF